ncbi:putative ATP-dependent RNA helicase ddx6 [Gurleya vavrai]
MENTEEINLMPELFLKGLGQYYIKVCYEQKLHCLRTLLKQIDYKKIMIFCNSVQSVERLGYRVIEMGFPCYFFHSGMTQEDRKIIFHRFTSLSCDVRILIGTDLLTRGIDIPQVNTVCNFDFPNSVESFLHRVGRAGRFGSCGLGINLIDDDEIEEMLWVEKQTGIEIKGVTDFRFLDYLRK